MSLSAVEIDISDSAMKAFEFEPELLTDARRESIEVNVAVWALVAAFLAIALSIVIFICSICNGTSFSKCVREVQNWWTRGCVA